MDCVATIVRRAARELTGADGATFVLREGTNCYYADEDAISPLWKGRRFPMSQCISGWVMLHREPVVLDDIYADPRIPADAYRPTFVKSLAMVPIRQSAPIGAIGNYWARQHRPTAVQRQLLQALADSTSVAMENVQVYAELERRVRDRTAELEVANHELEAFAYTVSHDLRAPLRHIDGFAGLLSQSGLPPEKMQAYIEKIQTSAAHMGTLIDDMLMLSRISRGNLNRIRTDLSAIAREIVGTVAGADPQRRVSVDIAPDLRASGDPGLLRIALQNLIANAWKFTSRTPDARIEVGMTADKPGEFYVRDNGVGFEMQHATRLFQPFQRLHSPRDFEGNGIGLATVSRIVKKHGGSIRAVGERDRGASFYFTLS